MIFSRTSEYALRALGYMASLNDGRSFGAREVSVATGVPPAYIAKLFQGLARAGILGAARGKHGGYSFRRDPSTLSLLDIVRLTDDLKGSPLSGCVMGLKSCGDENPCVLHPVWGRARDRMRRLMEETSVASISKSMNRRNLAANGRGRNLSRHMRSVFRVDTRHGRKQGARHE